MIALILAAGFGTRFRPATETVPKPLLPFLSRPILFHLFDHLVAEGVARFVLNSHHLAEVLEAGVGTQYRGLPVTFSREPAILGTAGGIRRAHELGLLGPEFVVANGDVYTTLSVRRLVEERRRVGALSALAVIPNGRPDVETPLWTDAKGRLTAVGGGGPPGARGPWLFTGVQAAHEDLLSRIPPGVAELARDVLRPSVAAGDGAFLLVPFRVPEKGVWFDLGSPDRLREAERALAGGVTTSAPISSSPASSRRSGSATRPG